MPRKGSIPHTKKVRSKGRTYLYFVTGQTKPNGQPILVRLPNPSLLSFGATYAAYMGIKTKRGGAEEELTVTRLCDTYEASPKFKNLSDGSKRLYRIYLDQFKAEYPTAPAAKLLRRDIVLIVDKRAGKPGAANSLLAVISALYKWARERGHVENDPCRDIALFEMGEWEPWPGHVLEAALAADDERVRLATHLLFYTAQRIGDVAAMRWSDIRDGTIHVRQQKTDKVLAIPLHTALAKELAGRPKSLGTIIAGPDGKALVQSTIRTALQKFAAGIGAKVNPHGLRKNAVNALLEAGCSAAQAAAISGQSLQMVEHYARGRAQGTLATAAILKWQGNKA